MQPELGRTVFRPVAAASVCALTALAAERILAYLLPEKLAVLPAIALAAVVYGLLIREMHVLGEADLVLLPKGEKLRKWLMKPTKSIPYKSKEIQ